MGKSEGFSQGGEETELGAEEQIDICNTEGRDTGG